MTLPKSFDKFQRIYCVDFEFTAPPGDTPTPLCMVALEVRSGRLIRSWFEPGTSPTSPLPLDTDDSLYVSYYSTAEIGCHLALGWGYPTHLLDLFVEFRRYSNGARWRLGNSLLDALAFFRIDAIEAAQKEDMRELAMRGGVYTQTEKSALLDYCQSDVVAVAKLLHAMAPGIDLPRSLLRGRYMTRLAKVENNGIPIDTSTLGELRTRWKDIQSKLIERVDQDYGVYEGAQFRQKKFAEFLVRNEIKWPKLPSGRINLSEDTFKSMSLLYPQLNPLRELRSTLSKMRLNELAVGKDGRNRCILSAFRAKTGRNQPSNSKFIFGPAVWLRSLIKPTKGRAIAYIDWEQQEFGIAASLSCDKTMIAAYEAGDAYLEFAKQAGAVPPSGTKVSHKHEREKFKQCALAVMFGMGSKSLALKLGLAPIFGEELLNLHRRTYSTFWRWQQHVTHQARLRGYIETVFGWRLRVSDETSGPSLSNFPIQANGAEMLRLAITYAIDAGITVIAPVHDALLIEANSHELVAAIATTKMAMGRASRDVLSGFELRSDVKEFHYPERYVDERGIQTWDQIMSLLDADAVSEPSAIPHINMAPSAHGPINLNI